MLRAGLIVAVVALCAARATANDSPNKEPTLERRPVSVGALLERLAKSELGPGEVKLLRAVTELMEKEEANEARPEYGELPGEAKPTRLWIRLTSFPAADAAKSVQELLDREQIPRPAYALAQQPRAALICEPTSNSILLSASPRLAESATKLLAKLDARPAMVTINVYIGEFKTSPHDGKPSHAAADAGVPSTQEDGAAWLADAKKKGRLELLERPQVTTLDGQLGSVQIGQRVPDMPNQTIGANLSLTPHIMPDGRIAIQVDFEDSQIDPKAAALTIRKSGIQTTLTAKEGQTIIVRVSGTREMIVALTPQIYRATANASSAASSAR